MAAAISLLDRIQFTREKKKLPILINLHTSLTFIVFIAGTMVTGAGPHAGDVAAPRLDIRIQTVATIHGGLVMALIALSLYLYIQATTVRKWLIVFIAISLVQGVLGYAQYLLGVPQLMVAAHLIGSALLWASAWQMRITQRSINVRTSDK